MYQNYTNSYPNDFGSSNSAPPYGGSSNSYSYGSHNNLAGSPVTTHSPSHGGSTPTHEASRSGSVTSRMNETAVLSLLQHLGKDDLQHLMDNDAKLQDLINDSSHYKGMQNEHDDLIATNKSLAEYNLSQQPKIEDLKQYVATEYEVINSLKTELAKDKTKLDGFVGQQSLDTLLALLQTETAKTEEESEELADKFCRQELDIDEFINNYLPLRMLAHQRRIKSERLTELIRDSHSHGRMMGQTAGTGGASWGGHSSHMPPYPDRGGAGSAPYPTSNFGMPQPNMYLH